MKKVIQKIVVALLVMLTSGLAVNLSGQIIDKLPRNTPESQGVSSAGIMDFLNAVDTGRVELHSYMFIRHGKVIAEGWWSPFGPGYKHILYSASKTFTATAIGLAISENRLKLTDKVISFFPYSLPDSVSTNMKKLTVQNMLMMSVGADQEPQRGRGDDDQIKSFIATAPSKEPGSVFKYNNTATFMLSAIVQQVTGQTVFDYLMPRIFQPLAIRGIDWDLNPQGINLGMIGLRLRTEDLAKFGQLLMQSGIWNGKQLIPKEWIKEATSFKIESNDGGANRVAKNLNDWAQGYCYQMWRGRNNSVRLDGMGGQFVVLFPDKDAVVIMTANARNTQDELNLMHNYLIPAIKSDKALPADPGLNSELQKKQSALSLKPIIAAGASKSDIESKISGKEFDFAKNNNNIQSVYFTFDDGKCSFALKRDDIISTVKTGSGSWEMSNILSSSLLSPPRIASKSVDANYKILQPVIKVAASYSWTDKNTLELTARFVEESLGSETIVCKFSEVAGTVNVSIEPKAGTPQMGMPGPAVTPLRGTLVKIK
jgi:CubicO group peptidase (beta-lactamase class C family)